MPIYKTFEVVFTVFIVLLRCTESLDCVQRDVCSCAFDDNSGVVELASLANTDGTPRFKDVPYSDGSKFSYNPCKGFNEGDCKNAANTVMQYAPNRINCKKMFCPKSGPEQSLFSPSAAKAVMWITTSFNKHKKESMLLVRIKGKACMTDDKGDTIQIGDADKDKVQFNYEDNPEELDISYVSGSGVITMTTVKLVCDQKAMTPTLDDISVGASQYGFTLTSVCACKNGCSASGPTKGGGGGKEATLGIGSILCIVFFALLFVYCVAGTVFMKFVKKAEGKEIVPNVSFWMAIPGHIKAGFGFVAGKVRRKGGTYDHI